MLSPTSIIFNLVHFCLLPSDEHCLLWLLVRPRHPCTYSHACLECSYVTEPTKAVPLTCHGHSRPITHLSFSSVLEDDQYYLISACKDNNPMLRDGVTGDWSVHATPSILHVTESRQDWHVHWPQGCCMASSSFLGCELRSYWIGRLFCVCCWSLSDIERFG